MVSSVCRRACVSALCGSFSLAPVPLYCFPDSSSPLFPFGFCLYCFCLRNGGAVELWVGPQEAMPLGWHHAHITGAPPAGVGRRGCWCQLAENRNHPRRGPQPSLWALGPPGGPLQGKAVLQVTERYVGSSCNFRIKCVVLSVS